MFECGVKFEGTAQFNRVVGGFTSSLYPLVIDLAGGNSWSGSGQSRPSVETQPKLFTGFTVGVGDGGMLSTMSSAGVQAYVEPTEFGSGFPAAIISASPAVAVTDAVTTAGSLVVTSATAAWTLQDIGMPIGGPGIPLRALIVSRTSATQITISSPATVTATAVAIKFGRFGLAHVQQIEFTRTHIRTLGVLPAVAVTAAAGPGATIAISGTDTAWTVTLTVGTAPAAGRLLSVTPAVAWGVQPRIALTPRNAAAAAQAVNVFPEVFSTLTYLTAVAAPPAGVVLVWDGVTLT